MHATSCKHIFIAAYLFIFAEKSCLLQTDFGISGMQCTYNQHALLDQQFLTARLPNKCIKLFLYPLPPTPTNGCITDLITSRASVTRKCQYKSILACPVEQPTQDIVIFYAIFYFHTTIRICKVYAIRHVNILNAQIGSFYQISASVQVQTPSTCRISYQERKKFQGQEKLSSKQNVQKIRDEKTKLRQRARILLIFTM